MNKILYLKGQTNEEKVERGKQQKARLESVDATYSLFGMEDKLASFLRMNPLKTSRCQFFIVLLILIRIGIIICMIVKSRKNDELCDQDSLFETMG